MVRIITINTYICIRKIGNMKTLRSIILIEVFLLCSSFTFDHDFRILTMQNGLVDNTVLSIYKDRKGFMWFGTANGLCRFDGRKFMPVKMKVPSMPISSIFELNARCLGLISLQHIYCFDRQQGKLLSVMNADGRTESMAIRIESISKGLFWILNKKSISLCRLNEIKDNKGSIISVRFIREATYNILPDNNASLTHLCYTVDRKGLFIGANNGHLFYFDGTKRRITKDVNLFPHTSNIQLNSLFVSNGFLWATTVAKGIARYHISSGRIDYLNHGKKSQSLSHSDVYSLVALDNNHLLAATWSGYTIITIDKNNPFNYTTEVIENPSASTQQYFENRLLSAYYNPDLKMIWLGTSGGGVAYADLRLHYYAQMRQHTHNEICGILADSQHYIWLATFHRGIMRSTTPYEKGQHIEFKEVGNPNVKTKQTVLCAYRCTNGTMCFGNMDGTLTSYDHAKGIFKIHRIRDARGLYNKSAIWSLLRDSKGHFWVGTNNGLLLLDIQSDIFRRVTIPTSFRSNGELCIRALAETTDGAIWLGCEGQGLIRLLPRSRDILFTTGYEKNLRAMQAYTIRSLLTARDGNLYIGYTEGLGVLQPTLNKMKMFYTTRNGLCSNFIGCIIEDNKGHIWLGNASGISRYSRHQHIFYNYYISGSNRSAMALGSMLFFGNNRNLTYLNPADIEVYHNKVYRVLITGLKVDNRALEIGEEHNGQVILPFDFSYLNRIVLSNRNRDFSISFNNLLYSSDFHRYEYRLYPYQKEWILSNEDAEASYTNLPEGEYTFEVRSIYSDGNTGSIAQMPIRIMPHWSHTIWFRILIILLVISAFAYIFQYLRRRQQQLEQNMKMKNELMMVSLKWEKERQIRKERENFFTSAAHELRTPLTLILAPLADLLHSVKSTEPFYPKLMTIYKNGTSLHTLVDHLLYVQKIEAGMVKLKIAEVDIIEMVRDTTETFRQLAESREINLSFESPQNKLMLWVDIEKILSAITNLLSNAFKYTPAHGTISVTISERIMDDKEFACIAVSDTGAGITHDQQEHIFDSFITGSHFPHFSSKVGIGLHIVKHTAELHHGQILLQSEINKGSTFTLTIPEGKEHFAEGEYETIQEKAIKKVVHETDRVMALPNSASSVVAHDETRKTILVVDDNPDIREYVCSLFVSTYRVLQAINGKEGVEKAIEQSPDLVISDIMMPVMNGFDCCRNIRNDDRTSHIPIIMLTAKAEDADVLKSSQCGADDYMMKPFNPEVLRAKVENLILLRERLKRIYTKAMMLKNSSKKEDEPVDEFIKTVVYTIEANMSDPNFNVKMLAEKLNMSQPTLFRRMKQHSDLSVVDMIRNIRISKAATLLVLKKYNIQEISDMVGFNDVRIFRKHFMQQFGVSPSNFIGE